MTPKSWNGDLRKVPFPELLAELRRERASGTLHCVRGSTTRSIQLDTGLPYWAASNDPDESARAWLFRRGRLPVSPLTPDGERTTSEFFDDPEVRSLIEQHAIELVLDVFSWGEGAFIFQPYEAAPATLLRFEASLESVLSRGLKRVHRLSAVRNGAGPLDGRVTAVPGVPMERVLTLDEDTCLVLGEVSSGTSAETAPEGWPSDYRVLLCLWELKLLGFVAAAESPAGVEIRTLLRGASGRGESPGEHAAPREPAALPCALREAEEPTASHAAPALAAAPPQPAVAATAMPAAAGNPLRSATRPVAPAPSAAPSPVAAPAPAIPPRRVPPVAERAAARAPAPRPDAVPPSPIKRARVPEPAAGKPAEPAPEEARPAATPSAWAATPAATVTNLDTEEIRAAGTAVVSTGNAAEWFKTGERFLRELDFHNAITSFREAVNLAPDNADYRFRLGTVLARNPKWRKEAEEHLTRATEIKPWDPRYQLALGKLYLDAGLNKKAEPRLRAALEADPLNAEAPKLLQRIGLKAESGGGSGGFLGRLTSRGKSDDAAPARTAPEPDTEIVG